MMPCIVVHKSSLNWVHSLLSITMVMMMMMMMMMMAKVLTMTYIITMFTIIDDQDDDFAGVYIFLISKNISRRYA